MKSLKLEEVKEDSTIWLYRMPLSDSAGRIEYLRMSQYILKYKVKERTVFPVQKNTCAVRADPSERMHSLGMLRVGQMNFHQQRRIDQADN
jgi:hypothetical protein